MELINHQPENKTSEVAPQEYQQSNDNLNFPQRPVEKPTITEPEPEKKAWGGWATIGIGLVIIIVFLMAQSFVFIAFLVAKLGLVDINLANLEEIINELVSNGLLLSISVIVSAIAGSALILLFIKVRRSLSISEYLGLHPIRVKILFLLLGVTIIMLTLSELAGSYLGGSSDTSTNFIVDAYRTSVSPVLLWIAVILFAPLFEEGFFRGFLFIGLSKSLIGPAGAIILTALFWSMLHIQYNFFGMVVIFILGIVLGIVRLKTRTLWGSITVHAFWNLLTMIGTVLYANGLIR